MRLTGLKAIRDQARGDAQRARVADEEVRIMESKGELLRELAAASGHEASYARRSQFCSRVADGVSAVHSYFFK